jgi:DNA-binding NarL/FixJ family response regulator
LPRTRVLLADDSVLIAAQIRELLEPAYDVVGVVVSGEDLESAFEELEPEVIVADIVMPGEGGLAAVRHIRDRHPGTPVVFLSVIAAPSMIRMSLASGGSGYVVKEDAADDLVPAIEAARQGRDYLSSTGRRELSSS